MGEPTWPRQSSVSKANNNRSDEKEGHCESVVETESERCKRTPCCKTSVNMITSPLLHTTCFTCSSYRSSRSIDCGQGLLALCVPGITCRQTVSQRPSCAEFSRFHTCHCDSRSCMWMKTNKQTIYSPQAHLRLQGRRPTAMPQL